MKDSLNHTVFSETDCLSEQTLFDYIDKKLNAKECHVVERHLLSCKLCSDAIEGLEMLKNKNRISKIKIEINKKTAKKETKIVGINFKVVLSIAASILLLVGGVFFFNLLNNSSERAALKEDEAPLSPSVSTPLSSEETQIVSDSVLLDAPKDELTKAEGEALFETPNTITGNHLSENKNLASKPGTNNNAIAYDNETIRSENIDTKFTSKDGIEDNTYLAENETNDYLKQAVGGVAPEERPEPVEVQTRAEKTLAKQQKTDKDEVDEKLVKANEKVSGYKKEGKSKKKNTYTVSEAHTVSADSINIAYAPQKTASALTNNNASTSMFSDKAAETETNPEYLGGQDSLMSFIRNNFNKQLINKNEILAKQNAEAKFTIDKKGKVTNPTITKGLNTELDKELLRVLLLLPKWKPASINGEKTDKEVTFPIQLVK